MHQGSSFIDSAGLPLQRPLGRLCVLPEPFLLISAHVFLPAWPDNHHTYQSASELPHLACIPAEFLPNGSLAIAGGLGCSPVLPLSECLLLDEERRVDEGINSNTGSERQCSSLELFHRTSWVWGYTLNPISPST